MSNLLFIKETIYKEEVDMIMKGCPVDKIIEEMDQKSKERKEKEDKARSGNIINKKIKDLETKLKTAEMLLKAGVISKEEFEKLNQTKVKLENDLKIQEELQEAKKEEIKTQKAEVLEVKEKKQTKSISNKKSPSLENKVKKVSTKPEKEKASTVEIAYEKPKRVKKIKKEDDKK